MAIKRNIVVGSRKDFQSCVRKMFIPNHGDLFPGSNINDDFNIGYALNHWTMLFFWNKDFTIYTIVELIDGSVESTTDSEYKEKSVIIQEYIDAQMKKMAMNIDEISIGQSVIDKDGSICRVTNKATNSVEVFVPKKTNAGISNAQYFDIRSFNDRFKIK